MIRIFEHTDSGGDTLLVDAYDKSLVVLVRSTNGAILPTELTPEAVTELRAALRPYDPKADYELSEEFKQGFDKGFETAREELAALTAPKEPWALDRDRVDALTLAAEVAKGLRSSGALTGAGAVSHEVVLAYALFLLGQINAPEPQK